MLGKIIQGDALEELRKLPGSSIDCCMTSPPYWALRDYGIEGQLGLEPTFGEYISKLCDIFDEVKRVMKPTGTCWVNLGDTYSGSGKGAGDKGPKKEVVRFNKRPKTDESLPEKSLTCIPFRFALEMINRGWILRNTIIWHKRNCMPQSVKDRFTVDYEYLFFFSKSRKYYFERQFEQYSDSFKKDSRWQTGPTDKNIKEGYDEAKAQNPKRPHKMFERPIGNGRNKRCVWTINPKPFSEAHFAVYPEELVETPIKAGCPEFVCDKCGKPREKEYETSYEFEKNKDGKLKPVTQNKKMYLEAGKSQFAAFNHEHRAKRIDTLKGYSTLCSCNASFSPGTVLDPFLGSGTTALVAEKLNRRWIGIELNPDYVKIAEKRLAPFKNQARINEVYG